MFGKSPKFRISPVLIALLISLFVKAKVNGGSETFMDFKATI
jgi:hypothetical protein